MADGLIFRQERIIIPEKLQRKIVKIGHSLGHLGKTKTKRILRNRYWFPYMNKMIDNAVDQCYECQVATKETQSEPIKPSNIPDKPWDTVSVDFGGPYPDGHYNLVIIDKRTRYPVVERVSSTSFQINKERLKHVFAIYGTPRRVESDNGAPFNSNDFEEFARQEGFQHHKVTPLHPRANGEAERFMQTLKKTEQIAQLQSKGKLESQNAIHDMLVAYRATPHPAAGISPYEAMRGMAIRTRLDYIAPNTTTSAEDKQVNNNDARYKEKMRTQRENSRTKEKTLLLGDYVLVKQERNHKLSTPYEPIFYIVCEIQGSRARRATDGRTVCRDASFFKLLNAVINTADEIERSNPEPQKATTETPQEEIKEKTLKEAAPDEKKQDSAQTSDTQQATVKDQHENATTIHCKHEKEESEKKKPVQGSNRPQRERRRPKRLGSRTHVNTVELTYFLKMN